MEKFVCCVCGYVYDPECGDPEHGVEPQTPFAQLPDDWKCPKCDAPKSKFKPQKMKCGANSFDGTK